MARLSVGGTEQDLLVTTRNGGTLAVMSGTLRWWATKTGGAQHTGLLLDGQSVNQIEVGTSGLIPEHEWPDGVTEAWAQVEKNGQLGPRVLKRAGSGPIEVPAATTTTPGLARRATAAEVDAGADVAAWVNPARVKARIDAALEGLEASGISAARNLVIPGASDLATKLQNLSQANPGKAIFLPAGTYDFTAPVRLYGPLVGDGTATVLRFPELANAAVRQIGGTNAVIRDLALESTSTLNAGTGGAGLSTAASHGLMLDGVTGFLIDNVTVTGRFVMGIHVRASHRGTVSNCRVTNTDYDGIHVANGCTDVSVIGNHVLDTGDDGIAVITYNSDAAPNRRIKVLGNSVRNVRRARGITVEGGHDCAVLGNTVDGTASRGILLGSIGGSMSDIWGCVNTTVAHNTVSGSASQGITVSGKTDGLDITKNIIDGAAQESIQLLLAAGVVVDGNVCSDNLNGNGIIVPGNAANVGNIIRGNTIRRPASRGIYNEGVGTVVSRNQVEYPAQVAASADGITCHNPTRVVCDGNVVRATSNTKTGSGIALTGTSADPGTCRGNTVTWDTGSGNTVFVAGTVTNLMRSGNSASDLVPAHTHTASQTSDFTEAVEDAVAALLARSSHVGASWVYNDASGTLALTVTGGGGGGSTDPEVVRDTIGVAMAVGTGLQLNVDDAGDSITISVSGLAMSQVTGLTAALDGKQPLDADLTAIAALPTTTHGRSLLTGADAAATRAALGIAPAPVRFSAATASIATTGSDRAEVARTITSARARVSGAPVGSALTAVVQHSTNGTTWSDVATLSIAAGSTTEAVSGTLSQAQSVGHLIRLNVTSVGSTTAATGVVVDVVVS